jgi:hypothetical protein
LPPSSEGEKLKVLRTATLSCHLRKCTTNQKAGGESRTTGINATAGLDGEEYFRGNYKVGCGEHGGRRGEVV